MINDIHLPSHFLDLLLARLQAAPRSPIHCSAGIASHDQGTSIILFRTGGAPAIVVSGAHTPNEVSERLATVTASAGPGTRAGLVFGVGQAAGWVGGAIRDGADWKPLDHIQVVGPGMQQLPLSRKGEKPAEGLDSERWSRSIGALGEASWRRLQSLHIGIVGCGRTGSLVANSLRKMGVVRLSLIDFDRLERHNLGEMDLVGEAHVGEAKSIVLSRLLGLENALAEPISSVRALKVTKGCDLLISCVDNSQARLLSAFLAMVYLKPILDIGTGVERIGSELRMGADVRLILPGRCLLCCGGVAGIEEARDQLRTPGGRTVLPVTWHNQRAGSLRSLNQIAAGLGIRLLEDLLVSRVTESVWTRIEFGPNGTPILPLRAIPSRNSCTCGALTGTADAGLSRLAEWLA